MILLPKFGGVKCYTYVLLTTLPMHILWKECKNIKTFPFWPRVVGELYQPLIVRNVGILKREIIYLTHWISIYFLNHSSGDHIQKALSCVSYKAFYLKIFAEVPCNLSIGRGTCHQGRRMPRSHDMS